MCSSDLKIAQALGAMDAIPKPFDSCELLTIVKNCLAGRSAPGQAA
jgi:DNA-binding response OmpR family regulator